MDYTDYVELEGKTVKRVISAEEDPKAGVFVTTRYFDGDNLARQDCHLEVSQEAFLAGMVNL